MGVDLCIDDEPADRRADLLNKEEVSMSREQLLCIRCISIGTLVNHGDHIQSITTTDAPCLGLHCRRRSCTHSRI